MKKQIYKFTTLIIFLTLILMSCENKKTNTEDQNKTQTVTKKAHSWTDADEQAFKDNSNAFLTAHGVTDTKKYTDCLLKTVIEEYPNPEDALSSGQSEMLILFEKSNCLDDLLIVKIESAWNKDTEALFLKKCKLNAKKNPTVKDAEKYCNCALTEIKKIIPNPQHVIRLTEEELDAILKKCK
jgi:uncharacterized protein YdcH (DUF465 family)